jgi:fructose-1,6-bisphosphatase I
VTNTLGIGEELEAFLRVSAPAKLARVLGAFANSALPLAHRIRRGSLDGFAPEALDAFADAAFIDGLKGSGVRGVVSKERDDPVDLDADGSLLVAIDPLDGASTVDSNISIGAVFSVLDASAGALKTVHFLQDGVKQRAAGFVIYGPHVAFVFTTGAGVHMATLDPDTNTFRISSVDARIPAQTSEIAINASNSRHWPKPVRAYIEDCLEGDEGPRGRNFTMRWVGSMVADVYRILARGGVYLSPEDAREGHANGQLRLLCQANPIAFLIEQAGGAAIDGFDRILEIEPRSIHMRTPLIFGSKDKVERVAGYYSEVGGAANTSPLFGKRGLLRR